MSESTLGDSQARSEGDRAGLELQHLQVQVEKLGLEVEGLRAQKFWDRTVGRYLPMLTALLAVAGFWVGLIQYNQERIGSDQRRTDELRRESARPFWDAQLKLYQRASEAAAVIATSKSADAVARAENDFWTLYWGPLAIVEDVGVEKQPVAEVEQAMVQFGRSLLDRGWNPSRTELQGRSLALAHAMRKPVSPAFHLEAAPLTGEKTR